MTGIIRSQNDGHIISLLKFPTYSRGKLTCHLIIIEITGPYVCLFIGLYFVKVWFNIHRQLRLGKTDILPLYDILVP